MKLPYYMQVKFSLKKKVHWAIFQHRLWHQSNTIEVNGAVPSYPSLLHSSLETPQQPFPSGSVDQRLEILEDQVSCRAAGWIWKILHWMT